MQTRLLALAALLVATTALRAQDKRKIDFVLESYLQREHAAGEMVDLFIHGSVGSVTAAVREQGGLVKMSLGHLVSARVPIANVRALAEADAVRRFEFSLAPSSLLCDSMRVKAHVNEVHAGLAPLPQAYDGDNVVVGIIDTGLDYNHPDVQNDDGTTRVAYYWDQNVSGAGAPPEFGYGREWTGAQIDAGQITVTDNGTHGTNVSGVAAGDGSASGKHMGVAPKADLIIVSFGGANFRAVVADGVKYIFDRALAMGKPAVVNISAGTYDGSHDGQDAATLFIDSLIVDHRGRMLVCAGGNLNLYFPIHLRHNVTSDTTFTWLTTNANAAPYNLFPFPNLYFDIWADAVDFGNVQIAIGADRVQPSLAYRGRSPFHTIASQLNTDIIDTLRSTDGNKLGVLHFFGETRGDQIHVQVYMPQPDSATYNWRLMSTGSGAFDVYSIVTHTATSNIIGPVAANALSLPFPDVTQYPDMAHYIQPDLNSHIVDSWACSDHTITVANYINQAIYTGYDGSVVDMGTVPYDISITSSAGPTRDLRVKPEIAAPGDITMTAGAAPQIASYIANEPFKVDPDGWHMRDGGTSIASPVVCGAVALYLQKCPNASWQQIRNAFISTATSDAQTGAVPNNRFGYGRVHAFNALVSSNLPNITVTSDNDIMCSNESVQVTAPAGYDAYQWSNGSTSNPATYTGAGPLTVVASTADGCAQSNALTFTVLPAPAIPIITPNGLSLTSSTGPAYQWYFNTQLIAGATAQTYIAGSSGAYAVEVTDANGCSAISAPYNVLITGINEIGNTAFAVWPSPTSDHISVRVPASSAAVMNVRVIDARGRVMKEKRMPYTSVLDINVDDYAPGSYTVFVVQGEQKWEGRFVKVP